MSACAGSRSTSRENQLRKESQHRDSEASAHELRKEYHMRQSLKRPVFDAKEGLLYEMCD